MPFKKGGPRYGGRTKGTPNKFTGELRQMILNALSQAGGERYLLEQASANPSAFMTLVGKVLPLQMTGDANNPIVTRVVHEEHQDEQPAQPIVVPPGVSAPGARVFHES